MDSLLKFSSAVVKAAEDSRQAELLRIRESEEKRLLAAESEIKSRMESRIRIENEKIKREKELELATLKNELKRKVTDRRAEMFSEVFKRISENISKYKNSPDYKKQLLSDIKLALEEMGDGGTVCYALAEDKELIKENFPKLILKDADEEISGGFCLENKEKHLYLDMTLTSRIEEQKKEFYLKSNLVLN